MGLELFTINTKNRHNDTIKLLAILFMIIDHIGAVFFPDVIIYRIIGRISFPLFAYQLTIGFKHTSNVNKYLLRLWIFALISQVPFTLLFDTTNLNIFFTLFLALFLLKMIDKKEYAWIFPIGIISELINVDYGMYGILLILLFYLFEDKKLNLFISFLILNVFSIKFLKFPIIQIFSMLSLSIIYYKDFLPSLSLNKKVSYFIYPGHLMLFLIISTLK